MLSWLGVLFRFIGRFGWIVQLCAALFLVGILLSLVGLVFGFSLGDVDAWLAEHSSWITAVADLLFRLGCLFVLICCAVVVIGAVYDKVRPGTAREPGAPPQETEAGNPPGLGCALIALVIGYLAFVGTFMRY